jgi:hypothetical protein
MARAASLPVPATLPATGPVRIELVLPAGRPGTAEPLVTTGEVGRGDTVFVYYESAGRLRFGWDSSSAGIVYSPSLSVDAAGSHRVLISMGSLQVIPPSGYPVQPSAEAMLQALLLVELDGRTVWRISGEFQPIAGARTATLGANRIGSSTLRPFFTGQILTAAPVAPAAGLAELMQAGRWLPSPGGEGARYPGAMRLRVRFPREAIVAADPLLVTGRTGKGDFLYVQMLDAGHLRFGFDHWAVGGMVSPAIAADLAVPHELLLTMDSLYGPGGEDEPGSWRGQVGIWLDGRRVLGGPSACHPAPAEEVILGYNLIGGSTTGMVFRGEILAVQGVSPLELGRLAP